MGRVTHGKRNVPVNHKPNSWKGRVFYQLKTLVKTMRGTPSTFALVISQRLGGVVSRQLVWDLLNNHNFTKKQQSTVPGFALVGEREIHLKQLAMLWTLREQLIFVDEKKFKNSDLMTRSTQFGYSKVGTRLPQTTLPSIKQLQPVMSPTMEVVGALSVLPASHIRILDDNGAARIGDIGLISYRMCQGNLPISDTLDWITQDLVPLLQPYPQARSVVLFDNLPQHRKYKAQITRAINARGAFVLWNSPNSPDLNPIEKLWDIVLAYCRQRMFELACGMHGSARKFGCGDLSICLRKARLTSKSYEYIFN